MPSLHKVWSYLLSYLHGMQPSRRSPANFFPGHVLLLNHMNSEVYVAFQMTDANLAIRYETIMRLLPPISPDRVWTIVLFDQDTMHHDESNDHSNLSIDSSGMHHYSNRISL